ncbi:hypothetical protein, partial [Maliponia aquimaris]|uniref:hypothetical protein n=1 Tax=Maliponia aquimaris TaxID=1673631 RepID=UPI0011402C33
MRDLVAAAQVARQELAKAHRLADTTMDLAAALARRELDRMDAGEVEHPVQHPVADLPPPCDHRRAHRPGLPARIDADAELRAFILARIDALTFPQLEGEVAKAFP